MQTHHFCQIEKERYFFVHHGHYLVFQNFQNIRLHNCSTNYIVSCLRVVSTNNRITFPFSSNSTYNFITYDSVKTRLLESEAEAEEPTKHNAWKQALGWVYSLVSACDHDFSIYQKLSGHKQNRCSASNSLGVGLIFIRSYRSAFLI